MDENKNAPAATGAQTCAVIAENTTSHFAAGPQAKPKLIPESIPMELQKLRQWLVWKYEITNGRRTKIPRSPFTGRHASTSDPATWSDFDSAVDAYRKNDMDGIGFVLTENDPYVVIDLDNKPEKPASAEELVTYWNLLDVCASYTELSPSGCGYHIVVTGRLSRPGMRRGNIEVYASGRYMAFTGNATRILPVMNCQAVLDNLETLMEPTGYISKQLVDAEEIYTDAEIMEKIEGASNATLFLALCNIPLADKPTMDRSCQAIGYPSPSEADLALINYLTFWSRNNEQVRRIFRITGLGKRDKHAQSNRLIDRCIAIARDGQLGPEQFAAIENERVAIVEKLRAEDEARKAPATPPKAPLASGTAPAAPPGSEPAAIDAGETFVPASELRWPPGTLGEIAQYLYSISSRPVQEIALASAFALCAGIGGRQFNTYTKAGLNQYLLIVGHTGIGKDEAQRGINNLLKQTEQQMGDAVAREYRGPGHFSSGQAVIRALDKRSCFFSVIGEFGLVMKSMNDRRGNVTIAAMHKKVLLDIYGKSGANDVLSSSQYSDNEKNTQTVHSPALTLLGETTPHTFYEGLTVDDIADGLLPRFHILEYTGERPDLNEVVDTSCPPALLEKFMRFAEACLRMRANNTVFTIPMTQEAAAYLGQFERECTARIREAQRGGDGPMAELWNRAHLKALRFASIAAAVDNPANPIVDVTFARWAKWEVERGTSPLLRKFKNNEVGTGDAVAMAKVRKAVRKYLSFRSPKDAGGYGRLWNQEYAKKGIVGYAFLQTVLFRQKEFHQHRLGEKGYLEYIVNGLIDAGELAEYVDPNIPATRGRNRKLYSVTREFPLDSDESDNFV